MLGIVPTSKRSLTSPAYQIGYTYQAKYGTYWALGSGPHNNAKYGAGDSIAVRLDLNANTVAFSKNGSTAVSPQSIPNDAYHFVFESNRGETVVSVVDVKTL